MALNQLIAHILLHASSGLIFTVPKSSSGERFVPLFSPGVLIASYGSVIPNKRNNKPARVGQQG